jgi:redox-sensitive bicupin YhaK (pirin superfamily)
VQVLHGALRLNGTTLQAGDGAAISDETPLTFQADADSELLLFDLA